MLNWSKKADTDLELCKCRFKFICISVQCKLNPLGRVQQYLYSAVFFKFSDHLGYTGTCIVWFYLNQCVFLRFLDHLGYSGTCIVRFCIVRTFFWILRAHYARTYCTYFYYNYYLNRYMQVGRQEFSTFFVTIPIQN